MKYLIFIPLFLAACTKSNDSVKTADAVSTNSLQETTSIGAPLGITGTYSLGGLYADGKSEIFISLALGAGNTFTFREYEIPKSSKQIYYKEAHGKIKNDDGELSFIVETKTCPFRFENNNFELTKIDETSFMLKAMSAFYTLSSTVTPSKDLSTAIEDESCQFMVKLDLKNDRMPASAPKKAVKK